MSMESNHPMFSARRLRGVIGFLLCSSVLLWFYFAQSGFSSGLVPNIECSDCSMVVVSIDVLRADHTSPYGYERDTSPNMNKLAEQGMKFAKSYSPSTWTVPSVGALLTMTTPLHHGLTREQDPRSRQWRGVSPDTQSVAGVMGEEGFATHAYIGNSILKEELGLNGGFDDWEYLGTRDKDVNDIVSKIEEWGEKGERFFLYVHFFGVHDPLKPPEVYHALFRDDALDYPEKGYFRYGSARGSKAKFIDAYDQTLRFYDDQLGQIVDAVSSAAPKTWIMVSSDHGTGMGENKGAPWGYGIRAYNEVTHVPGILSGPGIPKGKTIDSAVGQLDILYTAMAGLGVPMADRGEWYGTDLRQEIPDTVVTVSNAALEIRDQSGDHILVRELGETTDVFYHTDSQDEPIAPPEGAEVLISKADAIWAETGGGEKTGGRGRPIKTKKKDIELLKKLGYVE
jgi:arylsulfatase A-like enzyme